MKNMDPSEWLSVVPPDLSDDLETYQQKLEEDGEVQRLRKELE